MYERRRRAGKSARSTTPLRCTGNKYRRLGSRSKCGWQAGAGDTIVHLRLGARGERRTQNDMARYLGNGDLACMEWLRGREDGASERGCRRSVGMRRRSLKGRLRSIGRDGRHATTSSGNSRAEHSLQPFEFSDGIVQTPGAGQTVNERVQIRAGRNNGDAMGPARASAATTQI